ncbi:TPA: CGEA protein [Bacillus thuringiensis]|uniref:CGEA protein n=1 Tax=Bacillus thuringiensis TaxID=1428 RepID=A0A9W3XHR7_BACTU|nr:CGEA protein [Bacillus thuringiensis]HDR4766289.1 CGEA protein [Bacillus cereus]AQY37886.1 CGEA protein [Bacillus thuringiensis]MDR4151143.1 CGEA protein [Bacillus thuringiensis]MEC3575742.1 CGEA protein [Bacillus thuringiensis]MED2022517.1 CGEA protein [Bacillus thuringiensis]
MAPCTGIACYLLSNWPIGTIITVTTKSGQIIGPATLSSFYPTLCLVILTEEDVITPESTNTIFIGCEDIESVTLTT